MNSKRLTPFQSWLDWNPEHRMLYRFIISQLHYDGLSTIALVLAQSLHQINSVKPSNDLSQLVSMCVQWGQQAGNSTAFSPVLKPQATLAFSRHSDMLGALSQNKSSYEAELIIQDNLISTMRKHRSDLDRSLVQGLSPPPNPPSSLPLHLFGTPTSRETTARSSTVSPSNKEPRPSTLSSPSTCTIQLNTSLSPNRSTSPGSLCSTTLSRGGETPGLDALLMRASVAQRHPAEPDSSTSADVTCAGKKRPKSGESMGESGEESPKRQCQSDSSSSAEPISIKSEQEGTPSSPQLSSSAEENEQQGMFTPISALNSWTCPKCDTNVTNMNDLASHIKICLNGQGDNYCNECGRGYSSKASLQRHISVVHRKERNYECHICRKRFGQQIHVDVHMRLHTGEKPFVCHMCNDSFKQSAHLKRHMQCHIRSPSDFSLYKSQKPSPGGYKRDPLACKPDYDSLLPRISNQNLSPLSSRPEYPYLLSGCLTDTPTSPDLKDKFRTYGMMLGEPAVLGELQNKYTMELIKLIGQTAEEQRKNISR
ncbi:hypothetical protein ACHWQZ_G000584 [Mnemiopsis leidyi]